MIWYYVIQISSPFIFIKSDTSLSGNNFMKWYILRHAEKEIGDHFNPLLRHQDEPISANGKKTSQQLWAYFSDKPVSKIYISQYVRTRQTIAYVADKMKLTPIIDERLNEIDNGLLDGLSDQQIMQKFPDTWNGFMERNRDFQFPEGESGEAARGRIESFFDEKILDDEDIILVCHEGLIRLMMCHILGLPVYRRWDFKVDFCGIMEMEYQVDFGSWKLIRFNQIVA
jgi:broad specificity phosphatase PhoE